MMVGTDGVNVRDEQENDCCWGGSEVVHKRDVGLIHVASSNVGDFVGVIAYDMVASTYTHTQYTTGGNKIFYSYFLAFIK